jgi:translation initiation factor RLI1
MEFKSYIDGIVNNPKLNVKQKTEQLQHAFDNLDDKDPELAHKKQYIDEAVRNIKEQIDLNLRIVNRQNLSLSENSGSENQFLNSNIQSNPSIPITSLVDSNNVF